MESKASEICLGFVSHWRVQLPRPCSLVSPIESLYVTLQPTCHHCSFKEGLTKNCFPSSSAGKESTCNAGHPRSIPVSGRFSGEGIGYPLQYSWASMVAQLVKNPPAMWETWVQSLGWEDPLEKGKAIHSSNLAWRIPRTV